MKKVYYNEHDKYAAAWLRELIAAQVRKDCSSFDLLTNGRLDRAPTPFLAILSLPAFCLARLFQTEVYGQFLTRVSHRMIHSFLGRLDSIYKNVSSCRQVQFLIVFWRDIQLAFQGELCGIYELNQPIAYDGRHQSKSICLLVLDLDLCASHKPYKNDLRLNFSTDDSLTILLCIFQSNIFGECGYLAFLLRTQCNLGSLSFK